MAFTRKMIRDAAKESGIEIPKELEDKLVDEHISARDSYAEDKVKTALEENKPADPTPVKETKEYKQLKADFDTYKTDVEAEKSRKGKTDAAAAYFKAKGMSESAVKLALRGSKAEIDGLTIENGKIKDTAALDGLIAGDFASLVGDTHEGGDNTPKPNNNPQYKSKADILAIKDRTERQKAIAQNLDLFEGNKQ